MSYLALYRKYRPRTFDAVVGQEHITTSLINQLKNDSISHAYLFNGTRGIGKTSIAKIFARAINCEKPVNGSPCEKCETCKILSNQANIDVIEIDAASNNGVENIRDLREKVKYPPVNGRYKVYIIDEVHMLTDSAFNALLKTLEEPPKFVVFILATTEVHKLPATILSRCMRFDFKLVSISDLEKLVAKIFDGEKIAYEKEAVAEIAKLGEGSVRDALSIADMCVAYSNRNVTYEAVLQGVGATSREVLYNMALAVVDRNESNILDTVDTLSNSGKNINQFATDLSGYFRDLAVVKTTSNYSEILKYPKDILQKLKSLADKTTIQNIMQALNQLTALEQEFKYAINPRLLLEVTLLNLCVSGHDQLADKIFQLEAEVAKLSAKPVVKDIAVARVESVFSEEDIADMKALNLSAKQVLGKLSIALREHEETMLQVIMGKLQSYELIENVFTVYTTNELEFNTLNKVENIVTINALLKEINRQLKFNVLFQAKEDKDKQVLDVLKNKFKDILIVE